MEAKQAQDLATLENEITNNEVKCIFKTTCISLLLIQKIMLNRNISFEEVDFQTICEELKNIK